MKVKPVFILSLTVLGLLVVASLYQKAKLLEFSQPQKAQEQEAKIAIGPPVQPENLDKIPEFAKAGGDHLVYSLPEGSEVLATITGEVVYLGFDAPSGNGFFDNIQVKGEDGIFVSYLLASESEILIKQGEVVQEGQVIAKARLNGEEGPGCLGGEVLGVYLSVNGQSTSLTPDMIKLN